MPLNRVPPGPICFPPLVHGIAKFNLLWVVPSSCVPVLISDSRGSLEHHTVVGGASAGEKATVD